MGECPECEWNVYQGHAPGCPLAADYDLFANVDATEPVLGLARGKGILRTHGQAACEGQACPIHHPSDHPLNAAPLNWRADRGLMERLCEHGIGHPDPDDLAYKRRTMSEADFEARAFDVHSCDGCCR